MSSDKEQTEPRYYGVYDGVVLDNADPGVDGQPLGRLKLRVPGVVNGSSGWAFPLGGAGSGSAQRGTFDVPPIGSHVDVMFLGGDPEIPRWCGGHYGAPGGKPEVPTALLGVAPADQGAVKAYETDRWLVTYDDRAGKQLFQILDKVAGDTFLELDGKAMAVVIKGTTQVSISSAGLIDLRAPQIQLGGRTLFQNGKPIG